MSLRNDDTPSWSADPRPDDAADRVSHATWRIPIVVGQILVVIILVGVVAFFSSKDFEGDSPSSAEHSRTDDHIRQVEAVAFSPDGRTLASCSWDKVVRLWDVSRLAEYRTEKPVELPHHSIQFAIAFSPDGRTLAVGGLQSLTIWTRESGRYKSVFEAEGTTYRCLAFSPDGQSLALGGDDNKVRIWEIPSGRERAVLRGHADVVRTVAFSPDGHRLISTGQDRCVMLWDAIRGVAIRPLGQSGSNAVQFGAYSPDGRTVAVGESSGTPQDITLVDSETGTVVARLTGHRMGINALAFSPDGHSLASAGIDRSIRLWDVATGKEQACRREDVGWVKSISFSPDGTRLAFAANDASLRVWDLKSQQSYRVGAG
jgi:WD40 repeat protein